ncbi:AMP-binding protein [Alicyclobacillus tolerans]|uniref:acyl-CoA synthetase n=1 Tax=Alicyclobacillus tolerans TaxID=90970 RepID=UPI001F1AA383|nr:AMP-binding protein [Alicyclobacillus tolerans]MCF8565255.1 AMP-binding protein [Alicyclobacillus tolerans]
MDYRQLVEAFSWEDVIHTFDWNPRERFNAAHECCDRWAEGSNRIAVYWEDEAGNREQYTYAQLKDKSDRFANALKSLGVKKGDRVAALLGKDMALIITVLAAWKIGAIYVPLFTAFGPQAIEYRLQAAQCKVLVTNREQANKLGDVKAEVQLILTDRDGSHWDRLHFASLLENAQPEHETEPTTLDDALAIQFTSGTTGLPKGAIWGHKLIISVYPYTRYALGVERDDVFFGGADPGWAYGLINSIFAPMSFGVPIVVYKGPLEPAKFYELMERYEVTNFTYAPTAYRLMMAQGEELVKRYQFKIKRFSSAGEPLNAEVIRFFKQNFGLEIHDHYGATETAMTVNNFHAVTMEIRPGSMGFPTPGYRVALLREDGREVDLGQTGQIAVDSTAFPFSFYGYWQDPQKTSEKFVGKWFFTGDLARQDEDGYFWFQGRADDIISSAGYRIGPFEVESSLLEHPAVAEAAVIGKPDVVKGEVVKAYVVLTNGYVGNAALAKELSEFVKSRLSKHEYPREVEFVKALPKTPSGKIQRFVLRQQENS